MMTMTKILMKLKNPLYLDFVVFGVTDVASSKNDLLSNVSFSYHDSYDSFDDYDYDSYLSVVVVDHSLDFYYYCY